MSSKSVSQIFEILFQTGDGVFFSKYVQLKSSFCEKNFSGEIGDTLKYRSYRQLRWQNIKRKFHHWQNWELCKVIHIAKIY